MYRTCVVEELAKPCNRFVQSFQFHPGCKLGPYNHRYLQVRITRESHSSKLSGRTSVGPLVTVTPVCWLYSSARSMRIDSNVLGLHHAYKCCKAVSFMGLCPLTSDRVQWIPLGTPPQTHYKLALRARHAPYAAPIPKILMGIYTTCRTLLSPCRDFEILKATINSFDVT